MLKDLGHSTYSFAQSLLDEVNNIDASGLVVLRHTVGEVNISQYFIFQAHVASKTTLDVGHDMRHDVLYAKCGAQCRVQNVRHEMSICCVGRRGEPFFAVC